MPRSAPVTASSSPRERGAAVVARARPIVRRRRSPSPAYPGDSVRLPRGKSAFVSHVHCGASFKTSSHPRGGGPIGRRAPWPRDRGRPIDAAGFEILWSLFTGQLVSTNVASVPSRGTRVGVRFIHGRCAENFDCRLAPVNICVKVLSDVNGTV